MVPDAGATTWPSAGTTPTPLPRAPEEKTGSEMFSSGMAVPFTGEVSAGRRVARGEPLVDVDLKTVRDAGYDPTTILVVTNTASLGAVVPIVDGDVTTDATVVEIDH